MITKRPKKMKNNKSSLLKLVKINQIWLLKLAKIVNEACSSLKWRNAANFHEQLSQIFISLRKTRFTAKVDA